MTTFTPSLFIELSKKKLQCLIYKITLETSGVMVAVNFLGTLLGIKAF
jgi:hypothetical protein